MKTQIPHANIVGRFAAIVLLNAMLLATAMGALPTISVNFEGGNAALAPTQLLPTDQAGLIPLPNWNNINGNVHVNTALNDSNGTPTAVTISFTADESWGSGTDDPPTGLPNHKMLNGYLGISNDGNFRPLYLSNVMDGAYKLIIYNVQDGRQDNGYTINNDTTKTLHITHEGEGDWIGSPVFRRAVSTNAAARDVGNYVQFDEIQPIGGTITIDCRSEAFRGIMNGLQLIALEPGAFRFVYQPQDGIRDTTQEISFFGQAVDGVGAVTYQWYTNGVADTTDGLTTSYTNSALVMADNQSTYVLVATDSLSLSTTSRTAVLTVRKAYFTTDVADAFVPLTAPPSSAVFSGVVTSGDVPYTYQWLTNGVVDPSQTTSTYTYPGVTVADNGRTFQLIVTDASSITSTSRLAVLNVLDGVGKISASFTGRGDPCCAPIAVLAPGTVAGLIKQGNWFNIDNSGTFNGTTGPLNDGNGSPTPVTLTYDANDSWNNDDGSFVTGDEQMFKGISKAGGANRQNTYTFNNVPAGFYDVVVYLNVNGDNRIGDIALGGTTYYFTSQHTFNGAFIQVTNTALAGARDTGNYVRFYKVAPNGSSQIPFTFINRGDPDGIGISGIQIVSVPPPAPVAVSFTGRGDDCTETGCSTLAPATIAGLVPQPNWNNINNHDVFNGITGPLNDANGTVTTVTLNYDANDAWENDAASVVTGNEQMFKGISKANGVNRANLYTFSGILPGTYDLIAYLNVNGDGRIGDITAGGVTHYFTSQHAFGGTFIESVNINPVGTRDVGNYVRFRGIRVNPGSSNLPVSFINRGDPDGIGVSGFQLIQVFGPALVVANTVGDPNSVYLTFSAPMNSTALNPANYTLNGGVTVSSVVFASPNSNTVRLITSTMTAHTTYTLTVANSQDQAGQAVSPNPSMIVFTYGSEFPRASLRIRRYDGSGDFPTVLTKIANCDVPQRSGPMPDFEYTTSEAGDFDNGNLFGDGNTENYGMIVVGQFRPPTTGNYQFGFSSDDHGELFLSTDDKPANKVMIAQVPAWNGYRRYVTPADPGLATPVPSGMIPLVAGRTYYMEAVVAEGGGGDHVAVAVRHPGDPALVDFQPSVSSALFASNYIYNGTCPPTTFSTLGPVFLSLNLYNTNLIENSPVTFRIGYDGTPPYTVQWFSNGVPVTGATAGTNSTFTTFVTAADAGDTFYATVNNDFSSVTSVISTLSVTLAPQFTNASSFNDPANHIYVQYSKPMGASAVDITKYGVSAGVTVSAAAFHDAAQTVVRLDVSPLTPFSSYAVTATGVLDAVGNLLNPNPTVRNFTHLSGINTPQGLTVKRYDGATDLAGLRNKINSCTPPNFTDTAVGSTEYLPNLDNYGTWIYGQFRAPTTGNYVFGLNADDNAQLWLSTDANPANRQLLTSQSSWGGSRQYVPPGDNNVPPLSAPIPLVAGSTFYMEILHQEGTGGDHVSVTVQKPGDPAIVNQQASISRNLFATNHSIGCPPSFFFTLGPIVITAQPTNRTVTELAITTFRVGFDGSPNYFIQWYSNNVAIPNATNQAFTYQPLRYASNSQYYAIVANNFSSATSSVATLSVISDEVPPTLLSAIGAPSRTRVTVLFSEPLTISGATNPSNYQITNSAGASLAVIGLPLLSPDGKSVTLTTAAQTTNVQYFVVVSGVTDRAGIPNVINPNPSVASFLASELNALNGLVVFRAYPTGGGNTIPLLTGHPSFPNSPDFLAAIPGMNSRLAPAPYNNNAREGYGGTVVGHFIPPTSGNWIFYTSADDDGQLLMNTNGPSSAGAVEVRFAPGCCRALASGADPTAPFNLLAGQAYYMEARFKEGTGGDYIEVGARLVGDNSTIVPIGSANLAFYYLLKILQNPTNVTKEVGQIATFNVVANVDGAGAGSQTYQWQRSTDTTGTTFTNIPGGTNASFSLPVALDDNQFQFRAQVNLSVLQTNFSTAAILTVIPDTSGPTLVSLRTDAAFETIYLNYSEPVDPGTAGEASNYILYDPASTFKPQVGSVEYFGSNVVLHLVDPDNSQPMQMLPNTVYTLELDVQQDLAGNASVPSPIFVDFQTWVISCGFVRLDAWTGLLVPDANNLTPLVDAIAARPSNFRYYTNQVNREQSTPLPNGIDNYGVRFSGLFRAPETGSYKFEPNHDDAVRVRFSADSSPTNIVATFDEVCCNGFNVAENGLVINLTAGNLYYFEVLVIEGGGGDYSGLAALLPSGAYLAPIPGQYLVSIIDPTEAAGNNAGFDVQPQSQIIVGGTQATFTGSVTNPGPSGLFYQWQVNSGSGFTDIPGANSTSYTTPYQTTANDGDLYRLMACMPGRSIFSDVATLTVLTDNIKPTLVSARAIGPDLIEVTFSEPIDAGTAAEASNFSVASASGAIVVGSSAVGSDSTRVVLDLNADMPCEYITVTVSGVADLGGNVILPGSTVSFMNYAPIGLVHRYNFNNAAGSAPGATVIDLVGGAHGTVKGSGASFTGDRLTLAGGAPTAAAYVDLPNRLLSTNGVVNGGSGQVTIEGWIKITGVQNWSRIVDFGNADTGELTGPGGGGNGLDYLLYTASVGVNMGLHQLEVREVDPAPDGSTPNYGASSQIASPNFNTNLYFVITWDEATGQVRAYENGVQLGSIYTPVGMNEINDVNVWLGRSQYSGDANLQGEYDEIRIYNRVLSTNEMAFNRAVGPNYDFSQLLAVRLLVPTNLVQENVFQQATVLADFATISNVNLTASGCCALISSAPSVVSPNATGGLQALNAGTANIVATFAGVTSSVVTITVVEDVTGPTVVYARAVGKDKIELLFSEPLDAGTAGESSNFTVDSALSGAIAVSTAAPGSDSRRVVLDLATDMPCEFITVTIGGVADLEGNAIAPNTTVGFMNYMPSGLTHRYTFNNAAGSGLDTTVPDVIGTADGTVRGFGGVFTGSRVTIPGGSSVGAAYVDFPNGLLSTNSVSRGGSGQVSFEGWTKVTGITAWGRILDIGNSSVGGGENPGPGGGGDGRDYLFYSGQENVNPNRRNLVVREVDPLPDGSTLNSEVGPAHDTLGFNNDTHWVITWHEATGQVRLYENGAQVSSLVTPVPFNEIHDVNVWLGRSQWSGDANLQGEYDEFRIYNRVLSPGEVALNRLVGPDYDFSQLLAVRLVVPSNSVYVGTFQQATVLADFVTLSNVDLTASGCAPIISSSPDVIAPTATGGLTALAVGRTHLTAYFGGLTSSVVTIDVGAQFTAGAPISINDNGPASLYPSIINVSNVTVLLSKVTVTLHDLTHSWPDDIEALLVGPAGQKVHLMSDAGGGNAVSGITLTFDDSAPGYLSDEGVLVSGTYRPSLFFKGDIFPAPAPAGPYSNLMSAFSNGTDPNGAWSLYVYDDEAGDVGLMAGGWSLSLFGSVPFGDVAITMVDVPDPLTLGNNLIYTIKVTNSGPATAQNVTVQDVLPGTVTFVSASTTQGSAVNNSGTVTVSLGSMAAGGTATITIVVKPTTAGTVNNTVTVTSSLTDLVLVNNAASGSTTVLNAPAQPAISVNFVGCCNDGATPAPTYLLPTDVAGVVPLPNWNNLAGNVVNNAALNDSNNTPTTVTISYVADEQWGSNAGTNTPDRRMLNGYLGISNDGHYRPLFFNNVPNAAYKLIMYNGRGDAQPQGYTVNAGSGLPTLHITPESAFTDVWIRGTSTDPNARDVCNYVQFDEVSPINGTITIDCRSENFRGMMNGIQLIALPSGAFRFVNQPQDATLDEESSVTFYANAVDGTAPFTYQWYTNGVADTVNGLTNSYTPSNLAANENGRTFQLVATDAGSLSITSRLATLTVNKVSRIVSATSAGQTNKVFVRFSKEVALTGTYTLDGGITVFSAAYGATHRDVVLTTSTLIEGLRTVTATGETREDDGTGMVPEPAVATFFHGFGRFCSDFASLPAGTELFNNGIPNSGYIGSDGTGNSVVHLTDDGNNGAYGKLFISDRTGGTLLKILDARWRTRIGGPLGAHADGMSFNWANDLAANGNFVDTEEGEGSGVSFVMDTWDGGSGPDTGIEIQWNNSRIAFLHIPRTSEGNDNFICKDVFVDTSASVNEAGLATFTYNGNTISGTIPGWAGFAGAPFVFSARTGGENDNFWIDDVCINNITPGPVFFVVQPVETTAVEGQPATFTAVVDGTRRADFTSSQPYFFQWFSNGVPILGANGPSYSTPAAVQAHEGTLYSVTASNDFSSVTSSNAVLHVEIGPRVLAVVNEQSDEVRVYWHRPVDLNSGTYEFSGGIFEAGRAYGATHNEVIIFTDPLTPNTTYTLTIAGVTEEGNPANDQFPNPTVVTFRNGFGSICTDFTSLPPGASVSGTAALSGGIMHITDAVNGQAGSFFLPDQNAGFPIDRLAITFKTQLGGGTCCGARYADGMSFNFGSDVAGGPGAIYSEEGGGTGLTIRFDTWDNATTDTAPSIEVAYKGVLVGMQAMAGIRELDRPAAGPFIFDAGGFPLSLDTSNQFVNVRVDVSPSGRLNMYFKDILIFTNIQLPNYTPFVGANLNVSARTGGANANHWIDDLCINNFTIGDIFFTQQPADVTVPEFTTTTFTAAVDGTPPYFFQWYTNGVAVPGANGSSYTTPVLTGAAEGMQVSVVASNQFNAVTSSSATVHVLINPRIVSAFTLKDNEVHVIWTRPVDINTGDYSFDNGIFENARLYGANHNEIIIITDPLSGGTTYTLTVSGVTEEGAPGNVQSPDPTVRQFRHGYGAACADFALNVLPPGGVLQGQAYLAGEFLHINDTGGAGGAGAFFLPDQNGGFPLDRFVISFKTQIGNPTCCGGRGADGVSVNFGSDITASTLGGEEGYGGQGLTISFDSWDNNGADTAPAIEIKYKGITVATQAMAGIREGGRPQPLPFLLDVNGNPLTLDTSNTFANVFLSLTPSGKMDVYFKDYLIFKDVQLPNFTPFVNANLNISGRIGGANENHWFDDICINAFSLGNVVITRQPVSKVLTQPERANFVVDVDGLPPYAAQWYSNGVAVAGATALAYTTPVINQSASGVQYTVVVSNAYNSVTSQVATVTFGIVSPRIVRNANGSVTISWDQPGLVLQATDELKPNPAQTVWQDQPFTSPTVIPPGFFGTGPTNVFFRLRSP